MPRGEDIGYRIAAIKDRFTELKDRVIGTWSDAVRSLKDKATEAKDWVSGKVDDIVAFFTGLPGRIGSALSGLVEKIAGPFRDAYYAAKRWLDKIPGVGAVSSIGGKIRGGVSSLLRKFHSVGIVPGPAGREVPIMPQAGEGVFTPSQMAALGTGSQKVIVESRLIVDPGPGDSEFRRLIVKMIRKKVSNLGGGDVQRTLGRY